MYGLVMLTALSAGADPVPVPVAPAYGCVGGCFGSCSGAVASCYGSCFGCYGSCHGVRTGHGLFGHHRNSCHGCGGFSCSGWSCFGSSCHGCAGAACFGSCHGCFGGGRLGGGCWGPSAPQLPYSAVPVSGPVVVNYADPWAVYGRVNPPPAVIVPVDAPPADAKPMETPVAPKPKEGMGARLKFKVPADAKVYVDGRLTVGGGTERTYSTPPLAAGSKYYYDVKAEVVVGGKPVVEEKRVIVEAGANVVESFPALLKAVEGTASPVAGN
jgi:uncharacterized protein (TIGR03000 family)